MDVDTSNTAFYVENQEKKSLLTNFRFIKKAAFGRVLSHLISLDVEKSGLTKCISYCSATF